MVLGTRLSVSRNKENAANHSLCVLSGLCGGEKCGLAAAGLANRSGKKARVGVALGGGMC